MVVPVLQWLQFKVSGSVRCFIVYTFKTQGLSGASLTTFSGLRVGPVFHWLDFRDSGPLRCFGSCTSLWCLRTQGRSGGSLLTLSGIPVFTGCSLRTQGRSRTQCLPSFLPSGKGGAAQRPTQFFYFFKITVPQIILPSCLVSLSLPPSSLFYYYYCCLPNSPFNLLSLFLPFRIFFPQPPFNMVPFF